MSTSLLDRAAISVSTLCLAHCLLVPLAITILPSITSMRIGGEEVHYYLVGIVIPLSVLGLSLGCWKHRDSSIFMLGGVGLLFIVLAVLLGHDSLGDFGEQALTGLGSIFIVTSHVKNQGLCKKLLCCCNE